MNEFWDFLVEFERWSKEQEKSRKKGSKYYPSNMDPTSWLRDPKYKEQ